MSNLKSRVLSAAVLLPLVFILIWFSSYTVFAGVVALLSLVSGYEYSTMAPLTGFPVRRYCIAVFSSILTLAVAFSNEVEWLPVAVLTVLIPLCGLVFMIRSGSIDDGVKGAVHSLFGSIYTGCLWGFVPLVFSHEQTGKFWVLILLLGTVASDTFAFGVGKLWGKRKLVPRISPGKTWAGAFGGLLGTVVGVFLVKFLFFSELSWIEGLSLGVVLAVASQFGDLLESFLKRGFGVKDSSNLIPGHGGILDRCDALILAAPVVFLFSVYWRNFH